MNGNTVEKTVECAGLTKGAHTLTISTDDLPTNTDLTWKVVVNGTSVTNVEEYQNNQKLYHPSTYMSRKNNTNSHFLFDILFSIFLRQKAIFFSCNLCNTCVIIISIILNKSIIF